MKLLSPVGNMESLYAAVYNGADEVYLGVNEFNARNNIDGFTLDTLSAAVDFAHLYGVEVCLTVNILFTDAELPTAVSLVLSAYNLGVDAFIVQDLGLAATLHNLYPQIALHASTQMGLHNLEGVLAVLPYGFRRVVLSRETPLSEVRRIRQNTDVEIEYFVQGALCVSFSGNCYLSERMLAASGNRGRCKQLCRLPYTLSRNGQVLKHGYLLSAKDFCMVDRLPALADAGVDVLKIEGRARRPAYVAVTTAQYRRALDGAPVDMDALSLAYNRLFTPGYLDGQGDIISPYNNHIGLPVGHVKRVVGGKRFNEVYFTADRPLSPRSVLKMFDDGKECNTLAAFDLTPTDKEGIYRLTTTQQVKVGAEVRLIGDVGLEEDALSNRRRLPLSITLTLRAGEPLKACFAQGERKVEVLGEVAQPALNQPLTPQDLSANFAKTDVYDVTLNIAELQPVFVTKRGLNAWRRDVFETYMQGVVGSYKHCLAALPIPAVPYAQAFTDYAIVRDNAEPLPKAGNLIFSPEVYTEAEVARFVQRATEVNANPYLDTPNFALEQDIALLRAIVERTGVGVVANNYYALGLSPRTVGGGMLNVFNATTAATLGIPCIPYGDALPYMTLRHCPMQAHIGGDCGHCAYTQGYEYIMDDGRVLKLTRKKLSTCTFYLE